jgi:pyrroline-5-carboxylate reductase
MQEAAMTLGLSAEQGTQFAIETFEGAAQLAMHSNEPVAVLRERVTSKGGTTYAALTSMENSEVKQAIIRAFRQLPHEVQSWVTNLVSRNKSAY